MQVLRRFLKRSPAAMRAIGSLTYPFVWLTVKTEVVFALLSDWLIKRTLRAHISGPAGSYRLYRLIGKHFPGHRFTDEMAKDLSAHKLPLHTSLAAAIYFRYTYTGGAPIPESRIHSKKTGVDFARLLGLKVPKCYQGPVSFREITPRKGTVIKPDSEHSARGVFIVNSENDIMELNTGQVFSDWKKLAGRVEQLFANKTVHADSWVVEQYITGADGNLANDVKFNVFYGKMGWVAEMVRHPKILCYMMDADGSELVSGLYSKDQTFIGRGVTREEIEMVEKLSLEIPWPFFRIDFLRGVDGLVFGEFTPRPGIIGYFDRASDQRFGQMYHEAEARLRADLIAGKKFEHFNGF